MARFTPQETDDEIRRIHEDSAGLLGWSIAGVRSFSLPALREFVRGEADRGEPERSALARRVVARIDALLASGTLLSAEGAIPLRGRPRRRQRTTPVLRGKAATDFLAWLGEPPPVVALGEVPLPNGGSVRMEDHGYGLIALVSPSGATVHLRSRTEQALDDALAQILRRESYAPADVGSPALFADKVAARPDDTVDDPAHPPRRTMKPNPRAPGRTELIHIIQANTGYGYGWEDVSAYPDTVEGRKQARADIKEYRASNTGAHRLISRRVDRATQEPARRKGAKPNGARLKRTKRACSARGRKLKRSGDPKAASRLARYCPPPGRRKPNATTRRGFPPEMLDGNMSPATIARLKKLLAARLPPAMPMAEYPGSDVHAVLAQRKIRPSGVDRDGRDVWSLKRSRLLALVPSLLRSGDDDAENLGRRICDQIDIDIA